jgi:hypothetical protein
MNGGCFKIQFLFGEKLGPVFFLPSSPKAFFSPRLTQLPFISFLYSFIYVILFMSFTFRHLIMSFIYIFILLLVFNVFMSFNFNYHMRGPYTFKRRIQNNGLKS